MIITEKKLILITGSTDGIGYQAAIELAKLGHHVIIHGRNREKAVSTMNKVQETTKRNQLNFVYADLGSFVQIREMVNKFYEHYDRLDVLINNAGVIRQKRTVNQYGLEETFAINYLAPFYLTNLLLDLLENGRPSRIVNVVSRVHSNHFDFDNLQWEKGYTAVKAYAKSKTALILFTYLLAEKLQSKDIAVNCLHPGRINTKLLHAAFQAGGEPVIEGARKLVYAATSPELKDVNGEYFVNNRISSSTKITYNKEVQETLWKRTEEILKTALEVH